MTDVTFEARAPDGARVTSVPVECLHCGMQHSLVRVPGGHLQQGECPRCGYLGWAPATELNEAARRDVREHRIESRRVATGRALLLRRVNAAR